MKNSGAHELRSQRWLWADVTRLLAIYFVVQIHTSFVLETLPVPLYWPFLWFTKISIVCIPLFVMLSGALLLGKTETYTTFFKKRCTKVLIPWIVWTGIYFVYITSMHPDQVIGETTLQTFFRLFFSQLWFLPLIFSLYLLTPLFRIMIHNAKQNDYFYFFSIWFLFISVMPFLYPSPLFPRWEANLILAPIEYSGYFIVGYLLAKKEWLKKTKTNILLLFAGANVMIVITQFRNGNGFLDPGTVFASLFFFLFLMIFVGLIEKKLSENTIRVIRTISKASFGVYLVHGLLIEIVGHQLTAFLANYYISFFIPLLIFLLSMIIVFLLQRLPVMKNIVP